MNANPTATLWVFAYGGITPATHICVVRECLEWRNLEHWVMATDALISRSRSRVASQFLKSSSECGGDVLLMIDHDMQWQPGDLVHIARRALEKTAIVAGIYPKRAFGQGSAIRFNDEGKWRIGNDALISATYVGTGFIAIHRRVLEVMAKELPWIEEGYWPFFLPMTVLANDGDKEGYEYLSEDWAFCERARNNGFGIYADCLPRLTHCGNYNYRLVDATSRPFDDKDMDINLSYRDGVPSERK